MMRAFGSVFALVVALSGCASSLSGLDATDSYGCRAPEGVSCISVSGIYANSSPGGPLSRGQSAPAKPSAGTPPIYGASSVALAQPAAPGSTGNAIRSTPRLLRVWIAPWEDSDGDLHEDGYVHMLVDTGRWLIEHVRPAPRSSMDGVAPPLAPAADAAPSKAASEPLAPTPIEP
jgi:conjugal transfer pilus assembly protein TraV